MDEPTAGLDPGERNRFYNLLAEVGENVVVILSTHIVEDVMDLCNRMAILHRGRVLFEGKPDDAISELKDRVWQRSIAKSELPDYDQRYQVISSKLVGGRLLIHILSSQSSEDGFVPTAPDLEDVFFSKIRGWN